MTGRDPFDFGPSASPPEPGYGRPPSTAGGYGPPAGGYGWGRETDSGTAAPVGAGNAPPSPPPSTEVADDLVGRPPVPWLVASLLLGVVAVLVAALVGTDVTLAALAWFLAGPVGIALVAVYSRQDVAARARPIYDAPVALGALRWATGIALAAGIIVSALRIAEWAGRL